MDHLPNATRAAALALLALLAASTLAACGQKGPLYLPTPAPATTPPPAPAPATEPPADGAAPAAR